MWGFYICEPKQFDNKYSSANFFLVLHQGKSQEKSLRNMLPRVKHQQWAITQHGILGTRQRIAPKSRACYFSEQNLLVSKKQIFLISS